jgi:hypothetical protein
MRVVGTVSAGACVAAWHTNGAPHAGGTHAFSARRLPAARTHRWRRLVSACALLAALLRRAAAVRTLARRRQHVAAATPRQHRPAHVCPTEYRCGSVHERPERQQPASRACRPCIPLLRRRAALQQAPDVREVRTRPCAASRQRRGRQATRMVVRGFCVRGTRVVWRATHGPRGGTRRGGQRAQTWLAACARRGASGGAEASCARAERTRVRACVTPPALADTPGRVRRPALGPSAARARACARAPGSSTRRATERIRLTAAARCGRAAHGAWRACAQPAGGWRCAQRAGHAATRRARRRAAR